jgi:glutamine synthetase
MYQKELLYTIEPAKHNKEDLTDILEQHKEIKFVSFMGIDFAGNDTDEKVPISLFIEDMDTILHAHAAQTDGSSVVLPGIASLNNARVDMIADLETNWFIDYNYEHFDTASGLMVGTLRIPCFLLHNNEFVDSRHILKNSLEYVRTELLALLKKQSGVYGLEHINIAELEDIVFTCATELEFWVKSPREDAPIEALSSSQMMQEQYWQRTRGNVRTALEQAIQALEAYGLEPEMGHKECGGIRGQMDAEGHMTHVMEQLEIDWKYAAGVQTADNELLARTIVKEVFRMNGLEVSFQAKPILGVAGSGEHVHVGLAAKMRSGKIVNLMSPTDLRQEFLSAVGYGAIMGLLKNYEVINPFVSATNDSLNRLKPGFEAPVCIVTSLGLSPDIPSRNRTILAGLVRDIDNPLATRIEMRSPNPFTNTYLALTVFYLSMLDGIKACVESGKDLKALEAELSKKYGAEGFYLEKEREYRTEEDVFDDFSPEKRSKLFGKHPSTVWENMQALEQYPQKTAVLTKGDVLKTAFINSFAKGALIRWQTELLTRLIPENHDLIVSMKQLHKEGDPALSWDDSLWCKIQDLRTFIAKDTTEKTSIFTKIRRAIATGEFAQASSLQIEMQEKIEELKHLYHDYSTNILD